jgi:hypothetical protein
LFTSRAIQEGFAAFGVDRLDLGRIAKGTWMLLIKVSMDQSVTTFNDVQMQGQSTLSSSVGTLTQVGVACPPLTGQEHYLRRVLAGTHRPPSSAC